MDDSIRWFSRENTSGLNPLSENVKAAAAVAVAVAVEPSI